MLTLLAGSGSFLAYLASRSLSINSESQEYSQLTNNENDDHDDLLPTEKL